MHISLALTHRATCSRRCVDGGARPTGSKTWPMSSPITTQRHLTWQRDGDTSPFATLTHRGAPSPSPENARLGWIPRCGARHPERALTYAQPTHPGVLARDPVCRSRVSRHARRGCTVVLEDAINAFKQRDDRPATAHAMDTLSLTLRHTGTRAGPNSRPRRSRCSNRCPPAPRWSRLSQRWRGSKWSRAGTPTQSPTRSERSRSPTGPRRSARPSAPLSTSRAMNWNAEGIDHLRQTITLATALGQGHEVGILHNNLWDHAVGIPGATDSTRRAPHRRGVRSSRGLAVIGDTSTLSMLGPIRHRPTRRGPRTADSLAPRVELKPRRT